jgi:adenosylcobinamide-phosphate synthase
MNWARLHDPLLLLYVGLAIDAVCGEMGPVFRYVPHPVVLAGRAIAFLEARLNRPIRGDAVRRVRGVAVVIVLVAAAVGLGWLIQLLCRASLAGAAIEAVIIGVLVAQRSLYDHVLAVGRGLTQGGLAGGRAAVSHIVGRDPWSLYASGVARASIESIADNFSDGVVAPVFWYLVAGLPGLFAYKVANTLDSMIGHRSPRYRDFGWAAARLDDLLNLVPAPIAGVLIAAGAVFTEGSSAALAARIMLRDARKHRSPNAGWPEAAMAGALGLKLAGPRHYHRATVDDPYLGDGSPAATPNDIARALGIYVRACVVLAGLVLTALLVRHLMLPG